MRRYSHASAAPSSAHPIVIHCCFELQRDRHGDEGERRAGDERQAAEVALPRLARD